jgi:hypothetical protein
MNDSHDNGKTFETEAGDRIYLSFNAPRPSDNQDVFLQVVDGDEHIDSYALLTPTEATEFLLHLNSLLGNPLSYAPTAG